MVAGLSRRNREGGGWEEEEKKGGTFSPPFSPTFNNCKGSYPFTGTTDSTKQRPFFTTSLSTKIGHRIFFFFFFADIIFSGIPKTFPMLHAQSTLTML